MIDFLELARAAENDPVVLGVYADWLEENGEEEAALFLRDMAGENGFSDSLMPDVADSLGFGNGNGYGYGYPNGNGYGPGYGNIAGDGSGDGPGDYYYHGEGYGYGVGYGFRDGSGDGVGAGHIPY